MTEKVEIKKDNLMDKKSSEIATKRESPPSFFHNVDRIFDDLRHDFINNWLSPRPVKQLINVSDDFFRNPLTNVVENEKEYLIKAEMPGISKENISVVLKENKLEISAEHKEEKSEEKKGEYLRREYQVSNFYRSFYIPENVVQSDIDAKFNKGVLTIKFPKILTKSSETTKIEIK